MHVAETAKAAPGDQQSLAVFGQVADDLVGIEVVHHGADRHDDRLVLAGLAVHLAAHAVLAALRLEAGFVAKIDEGVEVLVGLHPDVAAIAAVAAIGAAERDELLATERNAAVAAIASGDGDFNFVDEFHMRDCAVFGEAGEERGPA